MAYKPALPLSKIKDDRNEKNLLTKQAIGSNITNIRHHTYYV